MKQADESSNGRQIDLALGETLEVRLPENRSTGFKWIVESAGGPACSVINDSFQAGDAVGQPGTHVWEFRSEQKGSADITISNRRSWEGTESSARTFTLRVQVSG